MSASLQPTATVRASRLRGLTANLCALVLATFCAGAAVVGSVHDIKAGGSGALLAVCALADVAIAFWNFRILHRQVLSLVAEAVAAGVGVGLAARTAERRAAS